MSERRKRMVSFKKIVELGDGGEIKDGERIEQVGGETNDGNGGRDGNVERGETKDEPRLEINDAERAEVKDGDPACEPLLNSGMRDSQRPVSPSRRLKNLRNKLNNEFSAYAPNFNRTIIIQRREGEAIDINNAEPEAKNLNEFLLGRLRRRNTEKIDLGGFGMTLAEIVEEVEKNRKKLSFPFLVISPYSKFKQIWSMVIFILLFYTVVVFPLRLAFFENDSQWLIIDMAIDCLFIADIVINFFSAVESESGSIIYRRREIAKIYLSFWFWIDFVSTFPIYIFLDDGIFNVRGMIRISRIPRISKISRMLKIIKVIRVFKFQQIIEDFLLKLKLDLYIYLIIRFSITLGFLLHFTGCGWYIIGNMNFEEGYDNWVRIYGADTDENIFRNYILSVNYICTVLLQMGSGPVLSTNDEETIFTSVVMFLGIAFFGEIMGSLSSCFAKLHEKKTLAVEREDFYIEFSKANRLPNDLLQKILLSNKKFFVELHNNLLVNFHKNNILTDLPSYLQHEVVNTVFKEFIKKIDFLLDKPGAFIQKFLQSLRPLKVELGNQVYKKFEPAVGVYFLIKGKVAMISSDNPATAVFYFEGSYFGELDILYKRTRTDTAYAETNLEVWVISRQDFIQILEEFPDMATDIRKLADERENNRKSNLVNPGWTTNFKNIVCQIEKDDYVYFHSLMERRQSFPTNLEEVKITRRRETFLRASAPKKSITELVGEEFEKAKNKKHKKKEYRERDIISGAKEKLLNFFNKYSPLELNENALDYILNFNETVGKIYGNHYREEEGKADELVGEIIEEALLKAMRLKSFSEIMEKEIRSLAGNDEL